MPAPQVPELAPDDDHNRALLRQVHPPDWVNPEPARRYNLVVLGGGTAGLVSAAGAAGLGARVALIEKRLLGGDCLNVGCVPSKALLASARAADQARRAGDFGVQVGGPVRVDFPAVMERMRRLRASISPNDSAPRLRGLGVDVFLGEGRFAGPDAVEVAGRTLRFGRAIIATGGRPATPSIPGLAEAGFLTNETVFGLTELPRRLAVIGAGPIGCELAQAFARFGAEVTVVGRAAAVLPREDADAAGLLAKALERDGVRLRLGAQVERVEKQSATRILHLKGGETVEADAILVAAGRSANVEGLGLEAAGVRCDERGVAVDDRLRTSNGRIFAAGDVCSRYRFTHAADALARIALQNSLFHGRARASALTVPWCTYTDPEIAHVGLSERGAAEKNIPIDTYTQEMRHVERALLDGDAEGFVQVHVKKGTDRILGATVAARHAGEMTAEVALAMANGLGLAAVVRTIHPYPTQAEAVRKAADAYNRTRLRPWIKAMFRWWFRWGQ
jgi:pyruvate/2-oxoglutarate dehydrogenase complex dihydrolipoamide dehydrogenase (E3) component